MIDVLRTFESPILVELQYHVVRIWQDTYLWCTAIFDNKKCNKVFLLNVLAWYPAYVARPRVMVERVWYYEKA